MSSKYGDALPNAVEAVYFGMSICKAAAMYGVPKSTVTDKMQKSSKDLPGHNCFLGEALELQLVNWMVHMQHIGYGCTLVNVSQKVQDMVKNLQLVTPFPNGKPGCSWYYSFMKQHPYLWRWTLFPLGPKRAGISMQVVIEWFHGLCQYLCEEDLEEILQDPLRIFNTDDSEFPLAPKPSKVIGAKEDPHIYCATSLKKDQITVMVAGLATAHYIPPVIVFLGECFRSNPVPDFPEASFGYNKTCWMDGALFDSWVQNVFNVVLTEFWVKMPALLLIDGAWSHINHETAEFCVANGITLYVFLPNATHIIQPLDLQLMRALRWHYHKEVWQWLGDHLWGLFTKWDFAGVVKKVWKKSATVTNAVNGFKLAGIFPFDMKAEVSKAGSSRAVWSTPTPS